MHYAHLKLKFIPANFNPFILKLSHWLLSIVMRFRLRRWLIGGIVKIEAENIETLVNLYQQFQIGKIRLLMAFHHPEVEDPISMLYLFSRLIPQAAKKNKIQLKYPIHSHFIYDRGMTIWGGAWLGWLLSRSGGVAIHRGKPLDRTALKAARELLINGKFPMTIAPEGATNGHSEVISTLEPGVAQFAFWCIEDLEKANRTELVYLLPIGIQYYFIEPPWQKLDQLFSRLEADSRLEVKAIGKVELSQYPDLLYQRLLRLGEYLIKEMEVFYTNFYHCQLPQPNLPENAELNQVLEVRIKILLDTALSVAETYFGLASNGTIIDRCRRLEEVSWNRIYREDIVNWKQVSRFQRGLADWVAEEAELRVKHMRLVESFVAVTGTYVKEKPTAERFAETALIIFDLIERIKGVKIPKRPRLGKRRVKLTIGEPILVNDRFNQYQSNRKMAKQAVFKLTHDLQLALEKLIDK